MNVITSKDNSIIKEIKKLKDRKVRSAKGEFIVEGFRFVEEALKSDYEVKTLIIEESVESKLSSYNIDKYLDSINTIYVTKSIMKLLASTETPQGVLAVVKNKDIELVDDDGFYIFCDKVQDPGNLGTIIRTAHASGALGVILRKGTVDLYNDKTLRSTMGSIFNVPVVYDNDDLDTILSLKNNGFKVISSSLDTDYNFYDIDLTGKCIIVVGNEGNGISSEIFAISDEKFKIPMPGGAESLNVGIATSVIAFEAVRQRTILKS
ncbi:RNA methyltransferase [Clostridium bornimense]|uniref:TrmH family RNA methyltransferase n=1 Tax=Clostridium bornimense TaxID=1216932 RepID=UPI001C112EB9|nr:RNA methyltransferase [Clostridium bornimense]MBU5316927.1 RNA methyltransferase [Clostridium bornimense]